MVKLLKPALMWLVNKVIKKAAKSFLKQLLKGVGTDFDQWCYDAGAMVSTEGKKLANKAGVATMWNSTAEPLVIDGLSSFEKGLKSN